ncbi:TIGR03086 family metal-binding protein [Nocardia sp. BMG111209]|uniref:TIGR03086 family metal-binding protein n=1 Tax=Nocardia sp. BMG111209 TaxID=1160137 RepID=UPI000371993C|nr:TIGR03086 family metal-binding protein [Nocardia sp. BMG111209]
MTALLRLDATALALIAHDVAMLTEAELDRPTPCTGWNVADLLRHMNERHEAVTTAIFADTADDAADPRDGFARVGGRWLAAMERTGDTVPLPDRGAVPVDRVLSIHVVDMLVHRWDIARALDRPCPVPDRLTAAALPMARVATAAGSPLNGPDGVYAARLAEDPDRPAMDNIAALLGRDPRWSAVTV